MLMIKLGKTYMFYLRQVLYFLSKIHTHNSRIHEGLPNRVDFFPRDVPSTFEDFTNSSACT